MSSVFRLQRKQVVWFLFGQHEPKVRPAVVLAVLPPRYVVIAMTSQHYPQHDPITVEGGSYEAREMGLTTTSYFYSNNIAVLRLEDIEGEPSGWCPTPLFHQLSERFADAVRCLVEQG